MADLSAKTTNLKSMGNTVCTKASEFKTKYEEVYSEVESLANNWKGADNQAFATSIKSYKEDMVNLYKVIDSYGDFMKKTAAAMDKLQGEITEAANKMKNTN